MPRTRGQTSGAQEGWEADLRLARRCATEQAAREELFRAHAAAVYRLTMRFVGNPTDAEDLVQEVFIEVFNSIHTYRGTAPLRSWLNRITVRRAYRHHRRRRTVPLELVNEPSSGASRAEAALDDRKVLTRLRDLLERVPASRRAVFILHEVEGYSLGEAAALLGISLTAAKKRVWRARRQLARLARRDPALRRYFRGEADHA